MISSSGGRRDSFSYVEGGVGGWLRLWLAGVPRCVMCIVAVIIAAEAIIRTTHDRLSIVNCQKREQQQSKLAK